MYQPDEQRLHRLLHYIFYLISSYCIIILHFYIFNSKYLILLIKSSSIYIFFNVAYFSIFATIIVAIICVNVDVLLTVHLSIILVINQLNAQILIL
jgi:hypothetical protein